MSKKFEDIVEFRQAIADILANRIKYLDQSLKVIIIRAINICYDKALITLPSTIYSKKCGSKISLSNKTVGIILPKYDGSCEYTFQILETDFKPYLTIKIDLDDCSVVLSYSHSRLDEE
jgi:hypothetical protein